MKEKVLYIIIGVLLFICIGLGVYCFTLNKTHDANEINESANSNLVSTEHDIVLNGTSYKLKIDFNLYLEDDPSGGDDYQFLTSNAKFYLDNNEIKGLTYSYPYYGNDLNYDNFKNVIKNKEYLTNSQERFDENSKKLYISKIVGDDQKEYLVFKKIVGDGGLFDEAAYIVNSKGELVFSFDDLLKNGNCFSGYCYGEVDSNKKNNYCKEHYNSNYGFSSISCNQLLINLNSISYLLHSENNNDEYKEYIISIDENGKVKKSDGKIYKDEFYTP